MGKYTKEEIEKIEEYNIEVEVPRPHHIYTQVDLDYSTSPYDMNYSLDGKYKEVDLNFWIWVSGEDRDGVHRELGFRMNAHKFLSRIATDKNVWLAKRHLEREIQGITQIIPNEEDELNCLDTFLERVNHSS